MNDWKFGGDREQPAPSGATWRVVDFICAAILVACLIAAACGWPQ
jgi:hypothetical protein